jgi:hypothetical protein
MKIVFVFRGFWTAGEGVLSAMYSSEAVCRYRHLVVFLSSISFGLILGVEAAMGAFHPLSRKLMSHGS